MKQSQQNSILTLDQANRIIAGALEASAKEHGAPLAVVVLDASGNVVAAQRQDGASMFRYDIALGKAWGAVAFGSSSRALGEKAKANPAFIQALAVTSGGRLLPNPGAVTIMDGNGVVIGAVGISGDAGPRDEAFAASGVMAAGLATGE